MAQVALLPDLPLGLRDRVCVGASLDYLRDARAKAPANTCESRLPALVLGPSAGPVAALAQVVVG